VTTRPRTAWARLAPTAAITSLALLALLAPGLAGAAPSAASAGAAGQASRRVDRLCLPLGHIRVRNSWRKFFVVRNDNFGGRAECLANRGRWTNFQVTTSQADSDGPESMAYPYIFLGCSWSICSKGTVLPLRAYRLDSPEVTWHTVQRAGGRWNAALDLWFNKTRDISTQADGAELMIWIDARHLRPPRRAPIVWADHTRWYLLHWVPTRKGVSWNLIIFRRVHPVQRLNHLHLHPFIRRSEHLGLVRKRWYLLNVEAGFEIWRGGRGLGTTKFWARTLAPARREHRH
jgi:Glycosyl hydrolase family 12